MARYIDYNMLNEIPVEDILSQMGVELYTKGKSTVCYCINPNCPDNQSKKAGAYINKKNNTLHCFVCGETYNSISIVQNILGFDKNKEGCREAAEYIVDTLGYTEALSNTSYFSQSSDSKEKEELSPIEIAIKNIQSSFSPKYLNEIGIINNPFRTNYINITNPIHNKAKTEMYVLTLNTATSLIKDKIRETISDYKVLHNNYIKDYKLLKSNPDAYFMKAIIQCADKETFFNMYEILTNDSLADKKNEILIGCKQDLIINIKNTEKMIKMHGNMMAKIDKLDDLCKKIMEYDTDIYKKINKNVNKKEVEEELSLE